jgi:hypothetical protein
MRILQVPSPSPPRFPGQQREGTPPWRSSPPAQRSSHGEIERASHFRNNTGFHILIHAWNRMDQDGKEVHTSLLSLALALPASTPPTQLSADTLIMATSLPRIQQKW